MKAKICQGGHIRPPTYQQWHVLRCEQKVRSGRFVNFCGQRVVTRRMHKERFKYLKALSFAPDLVKFVIDHWCREESMGLPLDSPIVHPSRVNVLHATKSFGGETTPLIGEWADAGVLHLPIY